MPDYKEMYLTMFRASEKAINILIEAQRQCEELYISAKEPELSIFPGKPSDSDSTASISEKSPVFK